MLKKKEENTIIITVASLLYAKCKQQNDKKPNEKCQYQNTGTSPDTRR